MHIRVFLTLFALYDSRFLECIILLEFYQKIPGILEFRDFCPIIARRMTAGVPLHCGHFIVQWAAAVEIKSLIMLNWELKGSEELISSLFLRCC